MRFGTRRNFVRGYRRPLPVRSRPAKIVAAEDPWRVIDPLDEATWPEESIVSLAETKMVYVWWFRTISRTRVRVLGVRYDTRVCGVAWVGDYPGDTQHSRFVWQVAECSHWMPADIPDSPTQNNT